MPGEPARLPGCPLPGEGGRIWPIEPLGSCRLVPLAVQLHLFGAAARGDQTVNSFCIESELSVNT